MLLIGDIHITSRFKDKIINEIKDFIEKNSDEQNIVFMGDYVYHFSYDRNAILGLYNLFLDLFEAKKNIYVLAGNHDWLGSSFVYEEAQKAFNIINKLKKENQGKLYFITNPILETIEGKKILFFPSMIDINNKEKIEYKNSNYKALSESKNKNEQISGQINQILEDYISNNEELTIIHHYYTNNTEFPGQRSRFSYKDIAIDNQFLNNENIKLISGHLHQGFCLKNYLCTGSLRSSSPLEVNQNKNLIKYNPINNSVSVDFININPYILIDNTDNKQINETILNKNFTEILESNKSNFKSNNLRKINFNKDPELKIENLNLSIKNDEINYEKIQDQLDTNLIKRLKDIKLKKNTQTTPELLKHFSTSTQNLQTGFTDRKTILKEYLKNKFQGDYQNYEKVLKELKLL